MRIDQIILNEGGKSDAVRYNSEVGLMAGFMRIDADKFNPAQPEKSMSAELLGPDADAVYTDIKKFLAPNFDEKVFTRWFNLGEKYGIAMYEKLTKGKRRVEAFGWKGGANQSDGTPADVEFIGSDVDGVSVKDEGGITLSNLTPKALGLNPDKGVDVFAHYAKAEYIDSKRVIFNHVLKLARDLPGRKIHGKTSDYYVQYNADKDNFTVGKHKKIEMTEDEIMNNLHSNAEWQRPFGDWYQANFMAHRYMTDDLYKKVAKVFEATIERTLGSSNALARTLQFHDKPYFYATPKTLYYVPTKAEAADLVLVGVKYAEPDGTSQLFKALVKRRDATDDAVAEIDIYVRYANGMFESNPTARVQNVRNPEFMAWEKLV